MYLTQLDLEQEERDDERVELRGSKKEIDEGVRCALQSTKITDLEIWGS